MERKGGGQSTFPHVTVLFQCEVDLPFMQQNMISWNEESGAVKKTDFVQRARNTVRYKGESV